MFQSYSYKKVPFWKYDFLLIKNSNHFWHEFELELQTQKVKVLDIPGKCKTKHLLQSKRNECVNLSKFQEIPLMY